VRRYVPRRAVGFRVGNEDRSEFLGMKEVVREVECYMQAVVAVVKLDEALVVVELEGRTGRLV
jgi:hypothetical protein